MSEIDLANISIELLENLNIDPYVVELISSVEPNNNNILPSTSTQSLDIDVNVLSDQSNTLTEGVVRTNSWFKDSLCCNDKNSQIDSEYSNKNVCNLPYKSDNGNSENSGNISFITDGKYGQICSEPINDSYSKISFYKNDNDTQIDSEPIIIYCKISSKYDFISAPKNNEPIVKSYSEIPSKSDENDQIKSEPILKSSCTSPSNGNVEDDEIVIEPVVKFDDEILSTKSEDEQANTKEDLMKSSCTSPSNGNVEDDEIVMEPVVKFDNEILSTKSEDEHANNKEDLMKSNCKISINSYGKNAQIETAICSDISVNTDNKNTQIVSESSLKSDHKIPFITDDKYVQIDEEQVMEYSPPESNLENVENNKIHVKPNCEISSKCDGKNALISSETLIETDDKISSNIDDRNSQIDDELTVIYCKISPKNDSKNAHINDVSVIKSGNTIPDELSTKIKSDPIVKSCCKSHAKSAVKNTQIKSESIRKSCCKTHADMRIKDSQIKNEHLMKSHQVNHAKNDSNDAQVNSKPIIGSKCEIPSKIDNANTEIKNEAIVKSKYKIIYKSDDKTAQINNEPEIQTYCKIPFKSNDERENKDLQDKGWDILKKLETDKERYKVVRKLWKNMVVPDPYENLTYHAYRRRAYANTDVLSKHQKDSRKRAREDCYHQNELPSSKRRRITLDLGFHDKSIQQTFNDVLKGFSESSNNCANSRFSKRKIEQRYREYCAQLHNAKEEARVMNEFYSGLPNQKPISQEEIEHEHSDIGEVYSLFKKYYGWDGNVFNPI